MVRNLIAKLKKNEFLAASFYSGLAAISKILSAIVIAKVVAVLLGPEGLALIGQLNNFILLCITLGGTAISQGIVKYVAQYLKEDIAQLRKIISVSLKLILCSSLLIALVLIAFSSFFSSFILLDSTYYFVFILLGFTLVLSGFNSLFTSVLNGYKEFKKFNLITIISNLFGLLITILLIYFYKIEGVLISLAINQTVIFGITYFYVRKESWFTVGQYLQMPFDRSVAVDLSKYALLSLFSTILVPIVTILIRKIIIDQDSLVAAGYYEFVLRVSSVILMFFSLVISTYYIPRISEIKDVTELNKEVKNTYKIVIPLVSIALLCIYLGRSLIVRILATDDFMVITTVYGWQSIADFLRISAQVLSFILVAKAYIKVAIIAEIGFNSLNLLLCYLVVPLVGFKGAIVVNCVMYVLYFLVFLLLYKYYIIPKMSQKKLDI